MSETVPEVQSSSMEEIFMRIASDLSMVADVSIQIDGLEHEQAIERPVGAGGVHISYRLGLAAEGNTHRGCLLMPLGDAQVLAASLLMLPAADVAAARESETLDRTAKDAVLEVGSFVTGATEAALRALGRDDAHMSFEGCQGVRPDVRPKLDYQEGNVLIVGRANVKIGGQGPSTWLMMLPPGVFPGDE